MSSAALAGLGFCIWGIYLFDRLFDVRSHPIGSEAPIRHQFAEEHRRLFVFLLGFAFVGVLVCFSLLPTSLLLGAVVLAAATLIYYGAFRFFPRSSSALRAFPGKESTIAATFVAGIFLCLWPVKSYSFAFPVALSLFLLFLGNCLKIAYAERDWDQRHDGASYSSHSSRRVVATTIVLPLLALALSFLVLSGDTWVGLALALSAILTIAINCSHRIPTQYVQALADLALLLPPALLLGWQHLLSR